MPHTSNNHRWHTLCLVILVLLSILLAACGSTAGPSVADTNSSSMPANVPQRSVGSTSMSAGSSSTSGQNKDTTTTPTLIGPQYLIKNLKVNLAVKDTRNVANDLQTWISTTDPQSSSAGLDYEPAANNLYNVTLAFSVQASIYPQIQHYLSNYAEDHGGRLLSETESVQDVTNDYVDTQSRLKNLRGEQQRLQTLMSNAQNLGDILTIEQKLTDIEGQIETIEAHLNSLTSQVTFYTVTISLQPIETVPPPPAPTGWSAGQIFHDAFAASLAFGQSLASFLIWLLAFSVYIILLIVVIWFARKWYLRNRTPRVVPPVTTTITPPSTKI